MCTWMSKLCCADEKPRREPQAAECDCWSCEDGEAHSRPPFGECCGCGCNASKYAYCHVGGDDCCDCCCGFGYIFYIPLFALILAGLFGLPVATIIIVISCSAGGLMDIWAYVMSAWYLLDFWFTAHMSSRSDDQHGKIKAYSEKIMDEKSGNKKKAMGTKADTYYPATDNYFILPVDSAVLHRDAATGEALDLAECVNALQFFIAPVLLTTMLVLGHIGLEREEMMTCATDLTSTMSPPTNSASNATNTSNAAGAGQSDAYHGVVIAFLVCGWLRMFIHVVMTMPPLLKVDTKSNLTEFGRSRARRRIREAAFLHENPHFGAVAQIPLEDLETPQQQTPVIEAPASQKMQRAIVGENSTTSGSSSPVPLGVVSEAEEKKTQQEEIEGGKEKKQAQKRGVISVAKGTGKVGLAVGRGVFSAAKVGYKKATQKAKAKE